MICEAGRCTKHARFEVLVIEAEGEVVGDPPRWARREYRHPVGAYCDEHAQEFADRDKYAVEDL